MNWYNVCSDTRAMEVGKGVIVNVYSENGASVSESICFVPDCRISKGGCGEDVEIVPRTETR